MVLRFFMIAGIFLLISCDAMERDNPYDKKGTNYVGRPVKIGEQVWMAKNLNVKASGSVCYDNDPTNCEKYGRLYDFATAMKLDPECNKERYRGSLYSTNLIPSSCKLSENHRGICPKGWHIPSYEEWKTLIDYLGGAEIAGKFLKSNDWDGDDAYGFSALPGGHGSGSTYSEKSFSDVGNYGYWWKAAHGLGSCINALDRDCPHIVYCANMFRYSDKVNDGGCAVNSVASVRCIKDAPSISNSSSSFCVVYDDYDKDVYCITNISRKECESYFDEDGYTTVFQNSCPKGSIKIDWADYYVR